jgi:hypothetical protein
MQSGFNFSCKQYYVIGFTKLLKCNIFSKEMLPTFMLGFYPALWWRDVGTDINKTDNVRLMRMNRRTDR